ncbi:YjgF-like protein [Lophiostoma macrostomum CBS 122681]|uniref:YjgF-like protein n=1 Tax=Lophiostoma macrostomum CBS 122681 TaxID=1314788 RepID=A0A6A6STR3_9PLEO|nr:YjgF-like protein [Lophiostoma macrostomum CBS 122681]
MVLDDKPSKLCAHGFQFCNWPGNEVAAQFGLSHAVIIPPNARTILVSGQIGILDDGRVADNITQEVNIAFDRVGLALRAAGLGDDAWEYVYKINTFEVSTPGLLEAVMAKAKSVLGNTKPAWTGVGVKNLLHPDLHLEITVEAFLPEPKSGSSS